MAAMPERQLMDANILADVIIRLPMTSPLHPDACPCGEGDVVRHPLLLTLSGEVDIDLADRLVTAWYALAEQAEHEVIDIDLHEVTFMDAAGLGLLLWVAKRQDRHGVQLRLRRPPARVTRLLELTGLRGVFPVLDGLPDAVTRLPVPRLGDASRGRPPNR